MKRNGVNLWRIVFERSVGFCRILETLRVDLDTLTNDPLWLNGPTWLGDMPVEGDSTMEEGSLKECMTELRDKHQSPFREAFSLLMTSGLETLICCDNYK